jgi:hypothetical protein
MGDAVIAAVVAGVVSLAVTFGKMGVDARQQTRQTRSLARATLDRYRAPLLAAVDDLGSRVNNIRHDKFLLYLNHPDRSRTALLGTLFRFAQLFGWAEIVYGHADRMRFESDAATKAVTDLLRDVSRTLAVDRLDRTDPADFTSTRLMVWREEQRAIGEAMRVDGDEPGCVGFHSFARDYEERYGRWFGTFASELTPTEAPHSRRLAALQALLAKLAQQLDVDRLLVTLDEDGELVEPRWARPASLAQPRPRGPNPKD